MGYHFRFTDKELKSYTEKKLIKILIVERKSFCTNYYSPLYKRLQKLETWVEENIKQKDYTDDTEEW